MKRTALWITLSTIVLISCGRILDSASSGSSLGELKTAKSTWRETIGALGESVMNGGIGVSGGEIFGVSANSDKGTVSIWTWDGKKFGFGTELHILDDWCGNDCTWGIDSSQILDLTGEGDDDIFVSFHLNDPDGVVFSQVSGTWKAAEFDLGLHGAEVARSQVFAYHEPCLPSCADGGAIPITYEWDGNRFIGWAVDYLGNKFTPLIGAPCTNYEFADVEPYKKCDQSEDIRALQRVLHDAGLLFSTSDDPVNGLFGPDTEYSVKIFQYQNELPVDGFVEGQWFHDLVQD